MDYELHVSDLETQKGKFTSLKSSAGDLVDACDSLKGKITGEISSLNKKVEDASKKISTGYDSYETWIEGYVTDLETTENTLASGIKAPALKGDFTNTFAKILIPALKSGASDEDKDLVKDMGSLWSGPYTPEEVQRILDAAMTVPTTGSGYCAAWVSEVFQAAGLGYPGGNACDMYNNWCTSSDLNDLKPGMIVAVNTHPHTSPGLKYGHVGIYIGDDKIIHNIGSVEVWNINDWINYYGSQGQGTVPAQWGWITDY